MENITNLLKENYCGQEIVVWQDNDTGTYYGSVGNLTVFDEDNAEALADDESEVERIETVKWAARGYVDTLVEDGVYDLQGNLLD